MGLVLGGGDFQVLTAFNAEEGWELCQRCNSTDPRGGDRPAMPDNWNGLELARQIRGASPDAPALPVTGYKSSRPLDSCSSLLPKPFTADLLRAAVRQMIE